MWGKFKVLASLMGRKFKWYCMGLMCEQGEPSLTRFLALTSFFVFVVITVYLAYYNINWQPYQTFASITGGGGLLAQIANKINNSVNNSRKGDGYPSSYLRDDEDTK